MAYIDVKDLHFSYHKKRHVLTDVSLSVEKGEWISILGHNGSGKSTLAKLLVGLLNADSGTIEIDGLEMNDETVYDIRKKIGIVFQNPDNQFVGVTVYDDIAFGMENLCVPREEMLKRIGIYADKVGMAEYLDKEPQSLSGGQKQRVAIAGILAMQTDIIIFDEATSMLDPFAREELMGYIRELHEEGLTVIMITHDISETVTADRLLLLKEGKIFADDKPSVLFKDTTLFEEAHLELPVALKIANALPDGHEKIKESLWQYTLER